MKILLLFILLINFESQDAQDLNDPESIFKEANLAFSQGSFDLAIQRYENLESAGFISTELYYNLGMSHHERGNLGKSVLYLERLLLLNPQSSRGQEALSIVRKEVDAQITEIPPFIVWQIYRGTINTLSSSAWAVLQIISGIIFVFLTGWLYFIQKKRPFLLISGIVGVLLLFLITWHFATVRSTIESGGQSAVVMSTETYLYSGPDQRSEEIARLSEGVKVYILDQIGEWMKVELEDRDVGWIERRAIEVI